MKSEAAGRESVDDEEISENIKKKKENWCILNKIFTQVMSAATLIPMKKKM